MTTAGHPTNLSIQSPPNWFALGLVLALHALAIWGIANAYDPPRQPEPGSPVRVRLVKAPPAPKPTAPPEPEVQPLPQPEPEPAPKPEPKPEPEPQMEHLVTQSPLGLVPLATATPPEPEPAPEPKPKAEPRPEPTPEPKPEHRPESEPQSEPHPETDAPRDDAPTQRAAARPARSSRSAGAAEQAPIDLPSIAAAYRNNPPPTYPWRSRRLGEEGRVLLRVHISVAGRVDRIAIKRSSGYRRLDRAALQAVRDWRFQPARRAGHPVPAWVLVPIHFKLN